MSAVNFLLIVALVFGVSALATAWRSDAWCDRLLLFAYAAAAAALALDLVSYGG